MPIECRYILHFSIFFNLLYSLVQATALLLRLCTALIPEVPFTQATRRVAPLGVCSM